MKGENPEANIRQGGCYSSPVDLVQQSKTLVRRFLEFTDPSSILHHDETHSKNLEDPISSWDTIYTTERPTSISKESNLLQPSIIVRSHPSPEKHLFSVQSVIPGVDARQFWTLMANSHNRHLWDSTLELSKIQYWLADEVGKTDGENLDNKAELESTARKLSARVELLRFGSIMFVANKRDMVLLCVDTQLPSSDGRLRLLSTSTSINVRFLPPKKGYNRFELNIGGFLVEDLGSPDGKRGGIRVTQVSDLGEMAAWVPASIIRMVASTMVPKSMSAIAKIASKMKVAQALQIEGSGYGGEKEREQEKDLCKLGGGSWPSNRLIPPILTVVDVLQVQQLLHVQSSNTHSVITGVDVAEPCDSSIDSIGSFSITASTVEAETSTDNLSSEQVAPSSSSVLDLSQGNDSLDIFSSDTELIEGREKPEEQNVTPYGKNVKSEKEEEEEEGQRNQMTTSKEEDIVTDSTSSKQKLSSSPQIFKQMSLPQRRAQKRISAMLLSGSDSLAMAIAPGARESMLVVAQILNSNLDDLENNYSSKLSSFPANTLGRRVGTSTSKIVPPVMTTTSVEAHLDAHSLTDLYTCSSSGSEGGQSRESSTSIPTTWTSSITEAPYTVAIRILNLAAWFATRPSVSSVPWVESDASLERSSSKQGTEMSRPTLSALSVTKQAYLYRDALRIRPNDRPQSHYRVDDTKLHPFPMINNENLPPLGIANGKPTCIMKRAPARVASLQEQRRQQQQQPQQQQQQQLSQQSSWWASYF